MPKTKLIITKKQPPTDEVLSGTMKAPGRPRKNLDVDDLDLLNVNSNVYDINNSLESGITIRIGLNKQDLEYYAENYEIKNETLLSDFFQEKPESNDERFSKNKSIAKHETVRTEKSPVAPPKPKQKKNPLESLLTVQKTDPIPMSAQEIRNDIVNSGCSRKVVHLMSETSGDIWPTSSPYACWYDGHKFTGPPVGIPERYEDDKFYLYGNFCSYECAMCYLCPLTSADQSRIVTELDIVNSDVLSERRQLLEMLCSLVSGCNDLSPIKRAPPFIILKKFGGNMTIEEYHASFRTNQSYTVFRPPLVPVYYQIEICTSRRKTDFVPLDNKKVTKAYKTMYDKRNDNLKNTKTIDKMFSKSEN